MQNEVKKGMILGASSYLLWGLAPIYFKWVSAVGAFEILAHRIVWSLVFLGAILFARQELRSSLAIFKRKATLGPFLLSSLLIASNWLLFIYAVSSGQTLEASFGYFMNPILIVLLGVVFFKERLSSYQWASLALAAAGVVYQLVQLGQVPWIALVLASTFGVYGLVRKKVSAGSIPGLFVETLLAAPMALVYLVYLGRNGDLQFANQSWSLDLLLMAAGVVTSVPLLLFASGARRLPYSMMGFLQYIAPSLQFLVAVLIFGETLEPAKLTSFALVWMGLVVLVGGSQWARRRARASTV